MYKKPTLEQFTEFVKKHDKRIGMRMIYKTFNVPYELREKFRAAWDLIEEKLNASEKQSSAENDGDSKTQPVKTVRKKPRRAKHVKRTAGRVRKNKKKRSAGKKKADSKKETVAA